MLGNFKRRVCLHTKQDKNGLVGIKGDFLHIQSHQLLHRLCVPSLSDRLTLQLRLFYNTQVYQDRLFLYFLLFLITWQVTECECYLSFALQIGLAECFYCRHIQNVRWQVIGHMICQVDHSNEGCLKIPNPEVLHQPAITGFIHVHPNKQDLKNTHK